MRPTLALLCLLLTTAVACKKAPPQQGAAPQETQMSFVAAQTKALKPLIIDSGAKWYAASVSGSDEAWAASKVAEDALNAYLADTARFAEVRAQREKATDPLIKRQLDVLYLQMLGKQVKPELLSQITTLQSELEKSFNTYRGEVAGKKVTQNEVNTILRTSKDDAELRAAWEANKGVGVLVAPKLKQLVVLRNEVAKSLGFRDYYALRIEESEQEETEILKLWDDLDRLTREPFSKKKADLDARISKRLGIPAKELKPWHYQNPFFQEPPDVFDTGLDAIYKEQDTLKLCRTFYEGIGLNVQPIIDRSDLYEKPGKTPHAFAADIDREGDIRVLGNIVPGLEWQTTMVHELGHAVYDQYIDRELPWLLRTATHPLTTEGLAMMLDRAVPNPHFAAALGLIDDKARDAAMDEARAYLALAPLQFSRWTQVMLRFERELYRDPNQNLNQLWWNLVEKYQGIHRPAGRDAPDYASKIHLVVAPVYYHNYMMGELFSAQVHETIAKEVGEEPLELVYVGKPAVGKFLQEKLFAPGARYRWDELTARITGSPLAPQAFARRFQ